MVVKYKGQKLRYVKDFHGKEVLWILSPEQIEMPGMVLCQDLVQVKMRNFSLF